MGVVGERSGEREGLLQGRGEREEGVVGGLWVETGLVREEGIEAVDRGGATTAGDGDQQQKEEGGGEICGGRHFFFFFFSGWSLWSERFGGKW